MKVSQAVILCGGKGTRLGAIAAQRPKPLVPVAGQPVLDYIIADLARAGIGDVILAAGHLGGMIEEYYRGHDHGCRIRTVIEPKPLGTAGALRAIRDELAEDFVLAYGDVFTSFDVAPMIADHERHRPLATLLVRPSDHPWDSDLVVVDRDSRVKEFVRSRQPGRRYENLANAAFYVLSRGILDFIPGDRSSDFGGDIFPAAVAAGQQLRGYRLPTEGFVKDMGTPQRLAEAEEFVHEKAIAQRARERRSAVRTVLFDRDGTLNVEVGQLARPEDMQLLPGVGAALARLKRAQIRIIVVTNQPVIARGLCDEPTLAAIHERLATLVAAEGGEIDRIYQCPHHPETHHDEGVVALRVACRCRKPAPGLIFRAVAEQNLDLSECVMVGNRAADVQAGAGAGIRTVLVGPAHERGPELGSARPDAEFESVGGFVDALLSGSVFR